MIRGGWDGWTQRALRRALLAAGVTVSGSRGGFRIRYARRYAGGVLYVPAVGGRRLGDVWVANNWSKLSRPPAATAWSSSSAWPRRSRHR